MLLSIEAAQRLESRGNPTVQVVVRTEHGYFRAIVPSAASTGKHEAVELRDGMSPACGGKGVTQAIRNVETIIGPALLEKGFDPKTQLQEIDRFMVELDGTENKSKLGANAILGVSMACARAGAAAADILSYQFLRQQLGEASGPYTLPVPFFNVLNGGAHSGNPMAFEEIMVAPVGARSVEEGVRMGSEIYHCLKSIITDKFGAASTGIGDEGGFAPPITTAEQAFSLLEAAIKQRGYTDKVAFGLDPASSEFYCDDGTYNLGFKSKAPDICTIKELKDLYDRLISKYPIILLEDPFAEDDWTAWSVFQKTCNIELVGDDLLVTHIQRIRKAKENAACNSLLLKLNQIGTVSDAIDAVSLAFSYGWGVFASHRSGEGTDDLIADLVVGLGAGHLKAGASCRDERVAKYNRLMDIEAELQANGQTHRYAGRDFGPKQES